MTAGTIPLREGIHDLTYDQRATWGWCPICQVKHGERCKPVGSGEQSWTHTDRIDRAPLRVRVEVIP